MREVLREIVPEVYVKFPSTARSGSVCFRSLDYGEDAVALWYQGLARSIAIHATTKDRPHACSILRLHTSFAKTVPDSSCLTSHKTSSDHINKALSQMTPNLHAPPSSKEAAAAAAKHLKHKRRFCRVDGCTRIVKSQGLCQRHGAKPRKCKVETCEKQAQGNFDGMCKSHFKAHKRVTTPLPPKPDPTTLPPPPEGESVYDGIIPASVAWRPDLGTEMPLIAHLSAGFHGGKPPAWHRNEERRARGLWPVHNPATQLEGWERELVWMEILLLTGNSDASFRHLARSWGRDKGFHMVLAQFICERRGNVERKKRERTSNNAPAHIEAETTYIGADVWDETCYGDAAYNEALAAQLFTFSPEHHMSSRRLSGDDEVISFDEDTSRASGDFPLSSDEAFLSDDDEKEAPMDR